MKQYFHPTDMQLEMVKVWLHDGWTRVKIAAQLGVSKGTVDGMVWRHTELMALAPHKPGFNGKPKLKQAFHWQRRPPQLVTKGFAPQMQAEQSPPPPPSTPGKTLLELTDQQCHYAIRDDPDIVGRWLFCGAPTRADSFYCPYHHRLAISGVLGGYKR